MLNFDQQGLIPAVIQDEESGQVLMVAFMNEEALRLTRSTGYTHFFSRSRQSIWRKGEQSGNVQEVRGMYVNCEENSLLLKVTQHGAGACHTGHRTCYYRQLLADESYQTIEEQVFDPAGVYAEAAHTPQATTSSATEPAHTSTVSASVSEQNNAEPASTLHPIVVSLEEQANPEAGGRAVSEQERASLEADMRQLYGAYIYLRDHDLSEESNTSRLLQEQSNEYLVARLGDELQELADVQTGTHVHSGRQADTVLEASQVGYWLLLLATTLFVPFEEIMPHEAILRGRATTGHQTLEQAQECLLLLISPQRKEQVAGLVMGFATIGHACAEADVSPLEPVEYDMAQMRKKGLVGDNA